MLFAFFRPGLVYLLLLGVCLGAKAQIANRAETAVLPNAPTPENVPRVPGVSTLFHGLNAGLTFSAVHDSSLGWYSVATTAVSYAISPHYSTDASVSIYPYRMVPNASTMPPPGDLLVPTHWDLGDTWFGVHASFKPDKMQSTTTLSMTVPTGNRTDGLSTGRVTFDLSDHLERYFGKMGGLFDVGGGDSSELFNRLVTRDYTSLGPIAHFQAGVIAWLPRRSYIQSLAYEQLPIGDQKVYTTLTMPGPSGPSQTVVTGRKVSEDNGFTTSVGIPLTPHITFLSYYNRSLRLHLDTVSTGVTYVFRGTPLKTEPSLIDRALAEGERLIESNGKH